MLIEALLATSHVVSDNGTLVTSYAHRIPTREDQASSGMGDLSSSSNLIKLTQQTFAGIVPCA